MAKLDKVRWQVRFWPTVAGRRGGLGGPKAAAQSGLQQCEKMRAKGIKLPILFVHHCSFGVKNNVIYRTGSAEHVAHLTAYCLRVLAQANVCAVERRRPICEATNAQ